MRPELEHALRRNGRLAFNEAAAEFLTKKRKRKPSEWATEMRKMPIGGPISGTRVVPYSHEYMPHAVEPMDAADDPSVRMIVLMMGVREGKTNGVCLNIIGRTVTDDPGGIYCVHPIEKDVEKFSADDIEPLIELSLSEYFVEKKSRDSGRTKDFKKYRGGSIRIPSAGAVTAFRGSTVKVLCLHEADALVLESIYKALGRTTGLADAIIVMESTPTLAPEILPDGTKLHRSVIADHYERGDMRKWFCRCAACGALQWLKYDQFRFPPGRMDLTRYNCEACDHGHDESEWRKMAREGNWYPTAGLTDEELADIEHNWRNARAVQPEIRSYWRNGFTSLLPTGKGYATKLHEFAAQGEAAKKSPEALKTWTNEVKCELWNPEATLEDAPPYKPLFDHGREEYGLTIPAGGLFLTCFVDCMLDRLEIAWRVFGAEEESWGMDHRILYGAVREPEVWELLRRELARRFKHAAGFERGLDFGLIDGGKYAEDVYRFLQSLAARPIPGVSQRIRASKGFGQHGHPLIDPTYRTVAKNLKGHHIGTWEAKDRLYEEFRIRGNELTAKQPSPTTRAGRMHWNAQFSESYFQQMTAEKVTVSFEKGQEIRKYENEHQQRNEGLDLEVGCRAAVRLRRPNWEHLEAEAAELSDPVKTAIKTAARAIQSQSGGTWATQGLRW